MFCECSSVTELDCPIRETERLDRPQPQAFHFTADIDIHGSSLLIDLRAVLGLFNSVDVKQVWVSWTPFLQLPARKIEKSLWKGRIYLIYKGFPEISSHYQGLKVFQNLEIFIEKWLLLSWFRRNQVISSWLQF